MDSPIDPASLFKTLIWDNLVKAVLAQVFAAVPLLGWGPIGMVVSYFIMKYADLLYAAVVLYIDIEKIILKNEDLKQAYDRSSISLKAVAHEKGIDSPEFRSAREQNQKNLSQFVRFEPARSA